MLATIKNYIRWTEGENEVCCLKIFSSCHFKLRFVKLLASLKGSLDVSEISWNPICEVKLRKQNTRTICINKQLSVSLRAMAALSVSLNVTLSDFTILNTPISSHKTHFQKFKHEESINLVVKIKTRQNSSWSIKVLDNDFDDSS